MLCLLAQYRRRLVHVHEFVDDLLYKPVYVYQFLDEHGISSDLAVLFIDDVLYVLPVKNMKKLEVGSEKKTA